MKNTLSNLLIGASGIGATEIVQQASTSDVSDVSQATSIIVQIVIGICTLFGIFKKKKNKSNS